jgi:phenylpropionate dioxygenase-like ring-hydroxylating dioxygenase large terminal subunit
VSAHQAKRESVLKELDFWHAALLAKDLKKKPVPVTIGGQDLALFRTADGKVGAVKDECPHRRMRLSQGQVKEGRLVCPYHGWSFDRSGGALSPLSDEPLRSCVKNYDCEEKYGVIWVKNAGEASEIPELHSADHRFAFVMRHRLQAPLELVLDNFTELEHSYTTHATFGFGDIRSASIDSKVEGDQLHIIQRGRPKQLPSWLLLLLYGMRPEDQFEADVTMRFSPPSMVSEHHRLPAKAPSTVQKTGVQLVFFFTPVNAECTDLFTLTFLTPQLSRMLTSLLGLGHRMVYGIVDYENRLDQKVLDNIANKDPGLRGMRLGRFDKPLGQLRVLLDRIYRGRAAPTVVAEPATVSESA